MIQNANMSGHTARKPAAEQGQSTACQVLAGASAADMHAVAATLAIYHQVPIPRRERRSDCRRWSRQCPSDEALVPFFDDRLGVSGGVHGGFAALLVDRRLEQRREHVAPEGCQLEAPGALIAVNKPVYEQLLRRRVGHAGALPIG